MDEPLPDKGVVELRDVRDEDVPIFFEHQADPDATQMAAFPARAEEAHAAHWARIRANDSGFIRTITFDGEVAGNILSWKRDDKREVGYWIGKQHWGRGIATRALSLFLEVVTERPLYAHVAEHNVGSRRVLEHCGFVPVTEDAPPTPGPDGIVEILMVLEA